MSKNYKYTVCVRKWKSWYSVDTCSSAKDAAHVQNFHRKYYKTTKIFKEEINGNA